MGLIHPVRAHFERSCRCRRVSVKKMSVVQLADQNELGAPWRERPTLRAIKPARGPCRGGEVLTTGPTG